MKLERYNIARSAVSELQSARPMTAGEAAATEREKYGAVRGAIQSVGEAFDFVARAEQEMDRADDKVTNAIEDARLESNLDLATQRHKELSLTDPEWTRDQFVTDVEAEFQKRGEAIAKIRDPQTRRRMGELHQANTEIALGQARADALELDAIKIGQNWSVAYNEAVAGQNWTLAHHLLDMAVATEGETTPIIEKTKEQELRAKLLDAQETDEINSEAERIGRIYMEDKESGDAEYLRVAKEAEGDRRTRLMDALDKEFANVNYALKRGETAKEVALNRQASDMAFAIENGMPSEIETVEDNEAFYQQGNHGDIDTQQALNRRDRVNQAIANRTRVNDGYLDFTNILEGGGFIDDDETNRKYLDRRIQEQVELIEGATLADYDRIAWENIQKSNILPQSWIQRLGVLNTDPKRMARDIGLYMQIANDPNHDWRTHMTPKQEADADAVMTMINMDYDMTDPSQVDGNIENAVESWWQMKQNPQEHRIAGWSPDPEALGYQGEPRRQIYTQLWERDWEERGKLKIGWFTDEAEDRVMDEDTHNAAFAAYMNFAHATDLTGITVEQAHRAAMNRAMNMINPSNINGGKELQLNALKGSPDLTHIAERDINSITTGKVLVGDVLQTVDSYSIWDEDSGDYIEVSPEYLDPDLIKFYPPRDRRKVYTPDGEIVHNVFYDGQPILMTVGSTERPLQTDTSMSDIYYPTATEEDVEEARAAENKYLRKLESEVASITPEHPVLGKLGLEDEVDPIVRLRKRKQLEEAAEFAGRRKMVLEEERQLRGADF